MSLEIEIDGILFRLIRKTIIDGSGALCVNIESKDNINFWVYQSNTELGLWRFLLEVVKSNNYPIDTTYEKGYDYVQSTLIHLQLQEFINANLSQLEHIDYYDDLVKKSSDYTFDDKKNDDDIHNFLMHFKKFGYLNPKNEDGLIKKSEILSMIGLNIRVLDKKKLDLNEVNKDNYCGSNHIETDFLKNFGDKIKENYSVLTIDDLFGYSNVFMNRLSINGRIMSITLQSKNDDFNIVLYFLKMKINQIDGQPINENENELIDHVTKKKSHYMPILLTTSDTKCNIYGLYDKYIPCGAFICKLFDYRRQCTKEEKKLGTCGGSYSYIGDRYDTIFPFNFLSEIQNFKEIIKTGNTRMLNTKDKTGNIPLMYAVEYGTLDDVQKLVQMGAKVDSGTIAFASLSKNPEIVDFINSQNTGLKKMSRATQRLRNFGNRKTQNITPFKWFRHNQQGGRSKTRSISQKRTRRKR